jgi:hypothetical protein
VVEEVVVGVVATPPRLPKHPRKKKRWKRRKSKCPLWICLDLAVVAAVETTSNRDCETRWKESRRDGSRFNLFRQLLFSSLSIFKS